MVERLLARRLVYSGDIIHSVDCNDDWRHGAVHQAGGMPEICGGMPIRRKRTRN
ncbi:hypothetical protein ACV229_02100 [Burkholderia sp. MR1-5-21]